MTVVNECRSSAVVIDQVTYPLIGPNDRLDMTGLLQRLLNAGVPVRTVPVDGRWCEVDSSKDLRAYERRLADADTRGVPWTHDWR